jgi:HEAT repeat protein
MNESPGITREALDQRIRSEVVNLEGDDLAWWSAHRVEPFLLPRHGLSFYAVAVSGETTLVFFDDRDAFGRYAPEPWSHSLKLYGDLADAVRCLATRDPLSRLLSETAEHLLRHGILERGDLNTQRRALDVLASFGPDAAVAVPKLIEIMSDKRPLAGLKETAIATLAAIGPRAAQAVPKLIEMAELDTANARGWCLQAFSSIGPAAASAVPLLVDLLLRRVSVDPDPFYVTMAARALGEIGAIEALPALLQVLRETADPDVADDVVTAIGKLGPEAAEAEPSLIVLALGDLEAIRFHDPADPCFPDKAALRKAAREALTRIGKPVPDDLPSSP